ncbi:hypothetical protein SODALDRAFT_332614 [Sodiomyces alkalinus F11]|uniref:60S ribosomal subunit assembly/export protein LOC1 n=1 Tax=Sodiomyces alkalinus (strain CBS 110278 / VKM F-3762 / F11) TaxID=1314773 RepID=A0A3N2PXF5_SODAK|nr:hypothetical protein SODALDRAFT_332614 [Sodiomyces alkalinus F11]ROT39191.1 hypothetical protein SODALDRAFT_332614 [Sodiomyces alkalinus F11]
MAPSRTKTVKNKHAGSKAVQGKHASKKPGPPDGIVKAKKIKGTPPAKTAVGKQIVKLLEKRKKNRNKTYTDEELGIPKLNKITPVGVQKPRGKKKGKVFVDDRESMTTILAMVQAEKEGQIESKIMKARQLEEIREARKLEAEKKEEEKKSKLEEVKDNLRKKRKRNKTTPKDEDNVNELTSTGTKATRPKKKVSFA